MKIKCLGCRKVEEIPTDRLLPVGWLAMIGFGKRQLGYCPDCQIEPVKEAEIAYLDKEDNV